MPENVVGYLAQQLDCQPEALLRYGERTQTRTDHLRQIQIYLGFQDAAATDLAALEAWLLERALEHDKPTLLFQLAAQKLQSERIVRPGVTVLERMVATARNQAIAETFRRLHPLLTQENRQFLDGLLVYDSSIKNTRLTWLRRPAIANSPTAILKTLEKLSFLKHQGLHRWDISSLNPNRLKFLAQLGKKSTNQALQRTPEERRYPILIAFACQMLIEITDEAMDLFIRCLAETYARARRDLEEFRLQEAKAINEKVVILHELGSVLLDPDVADPKVRPNIFERILPEQLQIVVDDCSRLIRPEQDEYYDFLAARYSYIRQFAPAFLEAFTFCSNRDPDLLLNAIQLLRQLNAGGRRRVPENAPVGFIPPKWQPYLLEHSGQISRRYYELCVLWELRSALRSGNIWLEGSRRYANPENYLIPKDQWVSLRSEVCHLLQVPEDGVQRLAQLAAELDAELATFNQTLQEEERVRLEGDELIISPLQAEEIPASSQALEEVISRRLPRIDLTDLLIEIDRATGFSECLVHAGGTTARTEEARVYLYAAILTQACNLGPTAMMAQIADLSYDRLVWYTNWYLREETLRPAINAVVNFQYQQPLSQVWGGGTLSSSDGQRFPVTVKNQQAVALPKYFGYGRGLTFYTWTSDQFSQYGDKVTPSTMRDAPYLLDGILDNETELTILEHTTDTAGYTEIIFAVFDALGLRFSPRIRDLGKQRLYRMNQSIAAFKVESLLKGTINQSIILERWDDMLRVAGSLKLGWVKASLFIGKLQSFPQQNALLRAFQEYGRLVKTIFILRYLNSEDYRRRINTQLNKGEALHALRRFLFFARQGQIRKYQQQDLANQSSCLTLVTNVVVAWNTMYMAAAIELSRQEGCPIQEEDLVHLSPARYEHVNPYGKYYFDIAKNLERKGLRPLRQP